MTVCADLYVLSHNIIYSSMDITIIILCYHFYLITGSEQKPFLVQVVCVCESTRQEPTVTIELYTR